MIRTTRTRAASVAQSKSYLSKAEEYLKAAQSELESDRFIAATSLAIHAAINACDSITGLRLGKRSAGQNHEEGLGLLGEAGKDGVEAQKLLTRLLPLKTKSEYEPDEIPRSDATKAVERAGKCLDIARRVAATKS